jgi:Asp/Glu/hydantoin racemase
MLRRLALSLGYADALAGVHVVAPTGAGLAGMAAALAGEMPIPLIDSVTAGVQALLEDSDAFSAGMTDGPPTSR